MRIGLGISIGRRRGGGADPLAYYVSNTADGTGDGHSSSTPITPAQLAAATIVEGQKIYFTKGEVYDNISLDISVDNVVIDAAGTGAKPVLSGSSVIASGDWTALGGGVYSIAKAGVKWLYLDGVVVENAKINYIQAASWPAANKIRVSADNKTYLNGFTNLVGLPLRIFDNGAYRMTFPYTITDYDSVAGDITVDRDILAATGTNYFFIYNYNEFLANEKWSWDGTTLKLQTALTVADHVINVGLKDVGINITGNNCLIQNIELKHYQKAAIKSYDKSLIVLNCTIHDGRGSGVYVYGNLWTGTISNNTIYNIGNNGIHFGAVASGTAENNTIYNIGNGAETGWPVTDAFGNVAGYAYLSRFGTTDDINMICGNGIVAQSDWTDDYSLPDSLTIRYNTIHDVAYGGVKVVGDNHIIDYNIIYNYANVWDDLQAIGTYAGAAATIRDASCKNISIKQNIIHDPSKLAAFNFITGTRCVGIYCDEASSDIDIDGNIIYGNGTIGTEGIFFYNSVTDIRVFNNIIKDYGNICISGNNSSTIKNIKVYDNIFYSSKATQMLFYASFYTDGGYLDRNTYINPVYSNVLKLAATSYTLANWITATGQDANSEYLAFDGGVIYTNATTSAVLTNIAANYKDVDGNDISSVTLQPSTGIVVFIKSTLLTGLLDGWNLNEASGNATGINGNILTNNNTVVYAAGKIGNAADLGLSNTNKSLTIDSVFGLTYVSARSISAWVNIKNIPASGDFNMVLVDITFATNPGNYTTLMYSKVSGGLVLLLRGQFYAVTLTPGTWYHIVVTWDHVGNESKLYLNSVLRITADSFTSDYSAQTNRLSIGTARGGVYASAIVDLVFLYDRVLSQAEVNALYNAGNAITHPFY